MGDHGSADPLGAVNSVGENSRGVIGGFPLEGGLSVVRKLGCGSLLLIGIDGAES